jgi:hypothetical protein
MTHILTQFLDQLYPDRQSSSGLRVDGFQSAELVGESLRILQNQLHNASLPNNSKYVIVYTVGMTIAYWHETRVMHFRFLL